MIIRVFTFIALLGMAYVFFGLAAGYSEQTSLLPLAQAYLTRVPNELGAPNVITGILITYRGLDTLGEVAVLFMVAAGVGLLLTPDTTRATPDPAAASPGRPPSELVRHGAEIALPMIFLFGVYVIKNGHLSAGGGFQGGAIVASGALLLMIAFPRLAISHGVLSATESLAGVLYVLTGVLGMVLASGFLDSRILPLGEFGAVFSAGAIPIISVLLGVKVGAELSVVIDRFRN